MVLSVKNIQKLKLVKETRIVLYKMLFINKLWIGLKEEAVKGPYFIILRSLLQNWINSGLIKPKGLEFRD